ncbi:nuclear body protein SP140-like protein isoform 3-T3 [Glossophaga mutica]
MASRSIRMSAEAQNIDNSIERMALRFFKMLKVEISRAIGESYPLLQLLHDCGFITSELYDVSKDSLKKGHNVEEVVYNILIEVEKKFDRLLKMLFDEFTLKRNPDLNHIYEIFKNESEAEENKEMHDLQSSLEQGLMDVGNKSALQKPKKTTSATQQPGAPVNRRQIIRVKCRKLNGLLIKRKLEQGATRKCIRTADGNWFTPREFELRGGYQASNWKTNLTCGGKTLKELIELGFLRPPPIMRERINQEENSDKCKICQDGGRLFRCEKCQSFFHGDCHLPPVDTTRNGWNCTFCTMENPSQSLQRYRESEVLEKQMGPEEKLKCEFLLLKVYHHLESNIFPNIPHGNYITKASQYLGKLRKLDTIKKKLIKENYCKVKDFMEAMDKVFQGVSSDKLHLNQEDFMKNFKRVFAIQEAN